MRLQTLFSSWNTSRRASEAKVEPRTCAAIYPGTYIKRSIKTSLYISLWLRLVLQYLWKWKRKLRSGIWLYEISWFDYKFARRLFLWILVIDIARSSNGWIKCYHIMDDVIRVSYKTLYNLVNGYNCNTTRNNNWISWY